MSRLPDRPLKPRRRQAFSVIYSSPGLTVSAIAHAASIPMGSVTQALGDLELLDLIYSEFDGRYRRYYPAPWTVAA